MRKRVCCSPAFVFSITHQKQAFNNQYTFLGSHLHIAHILYISLHHLKDKKIL
jgi:hypothetical protein